MQCLWTRYSFLFLICFLIHPFSEPAQADPIDCAKHFFRKLVGKDSPADKSTREVAPADTVLDTVIKDGQSLKAIRETPGGEERIAAKEAYYPFHPKSLKRRLFGVAALGTTTAVGVGATAGMVHDPGALMVAAPLTAAALYAVDWAGAFLHKFLDSVGKESNPIYGDLVRDFRIHHEDPNAITKGEYLDRISEPAPLALPFSVATLGAMSLGLPPEISFPAFAFALAGLHGTVFHQGAHTKNPSWPIRILQKLRIALPRDMHLTHHKPPFDGSYPVINGWSNGLAAKLDIWRKLDNYLWRKYQHMPHNWIQDPRSIPEEVKAEVLADNEKIPDHLWAYSETAFPNRVPTQFKEPLKQVRAKWRRKFIEERRAEYLTLAQSNPERAQQEWIAEQKEFGWIYGPNSNLSLTPEKEDN